MQELVAAFWGYLKLYQSRIMPVLMIGIVIEGLFLLSIRCGYLKYKAKTFGAIMCGLLLSFSIAVVITMTIYGRTPREEFAFRFQLFGSYVEAVRDDNVEVLLQIIMNIAIFVPIGLFLPCCFQAFERNRTVLLNTLTASVGIELIQGIARIGMFEFDDILGNVLGAEIGYLIWWGITRTYKEIRGSSS